MVVINPEIEYFRASGVPHNGYYLSDTLKNNLDDYFIKAVDNKFDGTLIISGIEGSGKTTVACTVARYVDPTFPGEPLGDGTPRRKCERIVFTFQQIIEAIDKAKPKTAIVIDEAVLSMSSQDFSTDIQKLLIKKFVTIRKKRLYIFIVIPSLFMLRKYFAIFRTRALIHCNVEEGYKRGTLNFYSYDTKRLLYLRGMKEMDQRAVKPDFATARTDTEGFFFDPDEYDAKKDEAILQITEEPLKKKEEGNAVQKKYKQERNAVIAHLYNMMCEKHPDATVEQFGDYLYRAIGWKLERSGLQDTIVTGKKTIEQNFIDRSHKERVKEQVAEQQAELPAEEAF